MEESRLIHDNLTERNNNLSYEFHVDVMKNPAIQLVVFLAYLSIFMLAMFGNFLVCFVVSRAKHMQTVTNYFIQNLALADIWLCALAVPFTPMYFYMEKWVFGWYLCTLVSMAQGTSVYVSTLTLTSIAIDRYLMIVHPLKPKMNIKCCHLIVIGIWILSIVLTIPYGIFVNQISHNDGNFYCEEFWPSEALRRAFSLTTTILQFVIPFIVILYCYVMISVRMSERIRSRPGSRGSRKEESDREKKKRTNRMLIAMVFIFGGCWLPLNIVHLIGDYYAPSSFWSYYNLFFFITHLIAMSSTCYNPILYAWLNENFRKEFQKLLPCIKSRGYGSRQSELATLEPSCNAKLFQDEFFATRGLDLTEFTYTAAFNESLKGKKKLDGVCEEVIELTDKQEEMENDICVLVDIPDARTDMF